MTKGLIGRRTGNTNDQRVDREKDRQYEWPKKKYKRQTMGDKTIQKTYKLSNTNPTKNLVNSGIPERDALSVPQVPLVLLLLLTIRWIRKEDGIVMTTSGAYPWSSVTRLFCNVLPCFMMAVVKLSKWWLQLNH
jgi:hypothetical protein